MSGILFLRRSVVTFFQLNLPLATNNADRRGDARTTDWKGREEGRRKAEVSRGGGGDDRGQVFPAVTVAISHCSVVSQSAIFRIPGNKMRAAAAAAAVMTRRYVGPTLMLYNAIGLLPRYSDGGR